MTANRKIDDGHKLPCDFSVGGTVFRKGVALETVRRAAERWYAAIGGWMGAKSGDAGTAWLIEFKPSVSVRPTYYGKTDEGLGLTGDHNAAIRFARKEDAEAVIADTAWTEAFAAEHMWCDPSVHMDEAMSRFKQRLHGLLSDAASRINAAR